MTPASHKSKPPQHTVNVTPCRLSVYHGRPRLRSGLTADHASHASSQCLGEFHVNTSCWQLHVLTLRILFQICSLNLTDVAFHYNEIREKLTIDTGNMDSKLFLSSGQGGPTSKFK